MLQSYAVLEEEKRERNRHTRCNRAAVVKHGSVERAVYHGPGLALGP
jgi:hypothetical protein